MPSGRFADSRIAGTAPTRRPPYSIRVAMLADHESPLASVNFTVTGDKSADTFAAGSSTADTSVTWFSVMVSPASPRSVETSVMGLVRDHVHGVSLRA